MGKTDASNSDQDITQRRWLLVDIDPTRSSGIFSSNEEHEEALNKAKKIRGFLSDIGGRFIFSPALETERTYSTGLISQMMPSPPNWWRIV